MGKREKLNWNKAILYKCRIYVIKINQNTKRVYLCLFVVLTIIYTAVQKFGVGQFFDRNILY